MNGKKTLSILVSFCVVLFGAGCASAPPTGGQTGTLSVKGVKSVPPTTWVGASQRLTAPEVKSFSDRIIKEAYSVAKHGGLGVSGPAVYFFKDYIDEKTPFLLTIAVPIKKSQPDSGYTLPAPFKIFQTGTYRCLSADFRGPVGGLPAANAQLNAEAKARHFRLTGENREVYVLWISWDSSANLTELQTGIMPSKK